VSDGVRTGFGAGEALAKDRKRMRVEGFTVKIMIEIQVFWQRPSGDKKRTP
jgi:hypothetical protein